MRSFFIGSLTRVSHTAYFPHFPVSFWSPNFYYIKYDFLSRWASRAHVSILGWFSLLNPCKGMHGPLVSSHSWKAQVSNEVQRYRSEAVPSEGTDLGWHPRSILHSVLEMPGVPFTYVKDY